VLCFIPLLHHPSLYPTFQLPTRSSTAHAPHLIHQRQTRAGSPQRVWLRSQSAGDPSTLKTMHRLRALHRIGQRTFAWAWLTPNNTSTSTRTSTNISTSRTARAEEVEGAKAGTVDVVDQAYPRAPATVNTTRRRPCLRPRTAIKPARHHRYKRPRRITHRRANHLRKRGQSREYLPATNFSQGNRFQIGVTSITIL
jgi:hypothetical protein